MQQEPQLNPDKTVGENVEEAFGELKAAIDRFNDEVLYPFSARVIQAVTGVRDGKPDCPVNDPAGVGGGVQVVGAAFGDAQGTVRYEPGHPLANKDGLVRYPDIDLGDQMTQLIQAQRSYQLNLSVIDRAKESYQQAINIAAR